MISKIINRKSIHVIFKRFLISLGIILLIRIGSFLPVPGINPKELALYLQTNTFAQRFINTFADENTFVIGLFTLNIFPYINASIFVQLLIASSPYLSNLQKEGDLKARRYINKLTRFITLILAIFESIGLGLYIKQIIFNWNILLFLQIILCLTSGAMIVLWLSELITDYGLGNGASLLIYINIVSKIPSFCKTLIANNFEKFSIVSIMILFSLIFFTFIGIILLQEGVRKIPLISSKQLIFNSGKLFKDKIYIPLKLNQSGVMPIILATTILVFPSSITALFSNLKIFSNFVYWIFYFGLIIISSFFYSTIVLNPKDLSNQLQKMSATIPGIRPGIQTTFYLKNVMQRLTILAGIFLGFLSIVPNLIESILNISGFNGLSTTSLIIMAGVLVDIVKEIDDIIFSNVYAKNN